MTLLATLGGQIRATRRRLRLTQQQLADRVGLGRPRIAEIERGEGGGLPIVGWIALGLALGRPLAIGLSRDLALEPRDGGHLDLQELVLRSAQRHGWGRRFEVPTRPAPDARSIDANRQIVRRNPAILRAEFPASSRAWVRTLTDGAAPPDHSGIVWASPTAGFGPMNLRSSV